MTFDPHGTAHHDAVLAQQRAQEHAERFRRQVDETARRQQTLWTEAHHQQQLGRTGAPQRLDPAARSRHSPSAAATALQVLLFLLLMAAGVAVFLHALS